MLNPAYVCKKRTVSPKIRNIRCVYVILNYPALRLPSPETGMASPRKVGSGWNRQ